MSGGELWAITSYFNPMAYRSRRANYETFRRRLGMPLVTVELAYGDRFELGVDDATRLIQLRSRDVMWQKERLLNLAREELPRECRGVVWLDCDVVFERSDWPALTAEALESHVLVQPFARVYDLRCGADLARAAADQSDWVRDSMAARYVAGRTAASEITSNMLNAYSPGHAWAVRRGVLDEVGLYDAMIVGGGDHLMAQAAVGKHETLMQAYELPPMHERHCRSWAARFHRAVDGRMGVVPGDLFHLWHGRLDDRRYAERQAILRNSGFDPDRDIGADAGACWRWTSNKPELHEGVRAYFRERREDGILG